MELNKLQKEEIRTKLLDAGFDTVSFSKGVWTARRGFFYTFGQTTEKWVGVVESLFPRAQMIDSGEVWKTFIGGAPIGKQSHWFVKFSI